MNDWQLLLQAYMEEMKTYRVGRRVQLGYCDRPTGTIVGQEEPWGLLAPKYLVRWDDGTTGRCSSSDLILMPEESVTSAAAEEQQERRILP